MPVEYDPLLSKLIAYGRDRSEAIARMKRAIGEYVVGGVKTNLPLFRRILTDPEFLAAKTDTGYLARLSPQPAPAGSEREQEIAIIGAAISWAIDPANEKRARVRTAAPSAWKEAARIEAME